MDRPVGTPCPAASHALLILGGFPDLDGVDGREVNDDGCGRSITSPATCATEHIGWWQVGHVVDSAPIVVRQHGHRLCGRIRVRLCCYCVASGDLSKGGDLELHPQRQALPQSLRARGHGGCGAR